MLYEYKIKVEFWIVGDYIDFLEMDRITGIQADETRTKKDFELQEFAVYEWSIDTGYKYSNDIEEQLMEIKSKIEDKVSDIGRFCSNKELKTGFCIVICSKSDSLPCTSIPKEFVSFAALLNAQIDFDIYRGLEELN